MKFLRLLLVFLGLYFFQVSSHGQTDVQTDFRARTEQDVYGTWLVFPSKQWSAYIVEQSNDLNTWAPAENGSYYGDGTDLRYFILDPPPPPAVTQGSGSTPPPLNLPPYESYSVSGALFPPPHDNKILLQGTFPTTWTAIAPVSYPPNSIWSFSFLNLPERRISMDLWFHHSAWNASYADLSPDLLNTAQRKAYDTVMLMYPQSITGVIRTAAYTMPPTPPDPNSRRFFRVTETLADSDGDGLPDLEEQGIGTSQWLIDTDGDGLSDGAEIAGGTDPNNEDSDGDGLSDGAEVSNGTDPTSSDSDADGIPDSTDSEPDTPVEPAVLAYELKDVTYSFTHTGSSGGGTTSGGGSPVAATPGSGGSGTDFGSLDYTKYWIFDTSHEPLTTAIAVADTMNTKLQSIFPFDDDPSPDLPSQKASEPEPLDVFGYFDPGSGGGGTYPAPAPIAAYLGTGGDGTPPWFESGSAQRRRVWLYRKDLSTPNYPESQTYLLMTSTQVGTEEPEVTLVPTTFTIEKGQIKSDPLDLLTAFKSPSSGTPSPSPSAAIQSVIQGLRSVDLDVDANMNYITLIQLQNPPVDEPGDERPYDLKGDGVPISLEESPASIIIRINNNSDSGAGKIDCEDDTLAPADLIELTSTKPSGVAGSVYRNQMTFSGPKPKAEKYVLKFAKGKENLRVFYKQQHSTPRMIDKNHDSEILDFGKFQNTQDPVKREIFVLEGVRAGTSEVELHLADQSGTPTGLLDKVAVTVNVDRLPDSSANMAEKALTETSHRHRVSYIKKLDATTIAEMNAGTGGNDYETTEAPSTPYKLADHFLAIRGFMKLHLPALVSPNPPGKLIPTATWDTRSEAPAKETTSYWIGMNDILGPEQFWIQFGVLVERDPNKAFETQTASFYLESGAGDGTRFLNNLTKNKIGNRDIFDSDQTALRNGIQVEFIIFKPEDGETLDPWKVMLRTPFSPAKYLLLETGYPRSGSSGSGEFNDMLKNSYKKAKPQELEIDSEFTQSVTAVAGFEGQPFGIYNLQGGLRLKPGAGETAPSNNEALWKWLTERAFLWAPINTATGKSKITLMNGGGTVQTPSKTELEIATSGQTLTLPNWPWKIKRNSAVGGAGGSASSVEMWDERKWLFQGGTGKNWHPGK